MDDNKELLLKEKEELQNRLTQLTKEKNDINIKIAEIDVKLGENNIREIYGVSSNDRDKRCNRSCSDCILPCRSCSNGKCEQCAYGYKTVVERLRTKYTNDELHSLQLRCPYALLAYKE